MTQLGVGRIERQRDKAHEAAGLVLQVTDMEQVLDLLLHRLDVPIEHGRVRPDARPVNRPGHIEPSLIVQLGPEQLLMDTVAEDLRPAAGTAVEPRRFQVGQHLVHRLLRHPLDLGQFDHRKGLDMDIGLDVLHRPDQLEVILVWEPRIDPGHHVDLTNRNVAVLADPILDILDAEDICPRVVRQRIERAELASFIADIRVIDV